MRNGWIKLHRAIIDWEWYNEPKVFQVFLHCLLKANHKNKKWRGKIINKGSFITSYGHLAEQTHLSMQQIRTALNKLKTTKEIATKTTNKYTMIIVCNYKAYQVNEKENNKQITNKQQTNNKQITTNKKDKNIKNDNNINISFSKFWNLYDKKVSKNKTVPLWNKLNNKERELVMDYIPKYIEAQPDKNFRKNPDVFLRNNAWEDEIVKPIKDLKEKREIIGYLYKCPECNTEKQFKNRRDYHYRCKENKCQIVSREDNSMIGVLLDFVEPIFKKNFKNKT